jgi:hypothetical protein
MTPRIGPRTAGPAGPHWFVGACAAGDLLLHGWRSLSGT